MVITNDTFLRNAALKNISNLQLRRQGASEQDILRFRKIRTSVNTELQNKASKLDRDLQQINFGGSIENLNNTLKNIDPNVKRFLKTNIKSIQDNLNNRIKVLEKDLLISRNKEKDSDRITRKGEQARQKGLIEGITKLKSGKFLTIDSIRNFSNILRSNARSEERDRKRKKERKKNITKQLLQGKGNLTKINFQTGQVIIDGKKFNLGREAVKDLELSSVRRANKNISNSKRLIEKAKLQAKEFVEFNKNISNVKSGKISPGLLLKQGKISSATATALVKGKELSVGELEKLRNVDISLALKKLEKPNVITDSTTSTQLFKTSINQALSSNLENPIPLNKSIEIFDKARINLNERIKRNKTRLQQTRINVVTQKLNLGEKLNLFQPNTGNLNLSKNEQRILENKFLTGQSVTPLEIQVFSKLNILQNKQLLNKQKILAKKILLSPVNYGRNLVLRFKKGESNPLFNDLKNLNKGILFGLKEIFIDPIIGSFDYGKSLVLRANKMGTSAQKIFRKDLNLLVKGISNVSTFVKKNKLASVIIINTAIVKGANLTKKEYNKNPALTLGKAIGFLFPEKILSGIGKLTKAGKLTEIFQAQKYSSNSFKLKQDLTTGKFKVNGNIQGTLIGDKPFSSSYIMDYNPKSKEFIGSMTTTTKQGKTTQALKFKDEGAFFIDLKTGEKLSKSKFPITEKKIVIKETEIIPTAETTLIQNGKVLLKQSSEVKVVITNILNTLKTITTRTSKVIKVLNKDSKKLLFALSKRVSKLTSKKRVSGIKKFNQDESKRIEGFLKFINFDKTIIGGIDKRTRLSIALGLRKSQAPLKAFETILGKDGKVRGIFRIGKLEAKGKLVEGIPPIEKSKRINFNLRRNKKGTFNIIPDNKINIITKNKKGIYTKDFIELPPLKFKPPKTKFKLKALGIFGSLNKLKTKIKLISSLQNQLTEKSLKQIKELAKEIKQEITKINIQIKKRGSELISKKVIKIKSIPKLKPKSISKKTFKVPRVPRVPKKPKVPKKLKKLRFSLDFNSKPPKGFNLAVDVFYRSKGNIRKAGLKLPMNKGIMELARLLDNTTSRSAELRVVGFTKSKDVQLSPTVLRKFRKRKTNKVLKIVEKRKFGIDTRGEKKGLKIAKAIKKKTRFKAPIKTKSKSKLKPKSKNTKKKKSIVKRPLKKKFKKVIKKKQKKVIKKKGNKNKK